MLPVFELFLTLLLTDEWREPMKFDNDWERIREFSKLLYEVSQIPIQIADIHGATRLFFPSLPEFQEIGLPRSISESLIARAKQGPVLQTYHSVL